MRWLPLELWEHWGKPWLHRRRLAFGLDGTNHGAERAMSTSNVRSKVLSDSRRMGGYQRLAGLANEIALPQWRYGAAAQHELAAALAA